MAVRIRLKRIGAKKNPVYRIVVTDDRSARDGSFIEGLGTYDPTKEKSILSLNKERVRYWLDKGALCSETVKSILKKI